MKILKPFPVISRAQRWAAFEPWERAIVERMEREALRVRAALGRDGWSPEHDALLDRWNDNG